MKASSSSSFSLSVLGDYKRSGGARFFRHRVITFGLRSHPSITKFNPNFSIVYKQTPLSTKSSSSVLLTFSFDSSPSILSSSSKNRACFAYRR
ncbi:hypothetical protein Bca101_098728 [Brassica carinata]